MKTISKKLIATIACVVLVVSCSISAFAYADIYACQKCGQSLSKIAYIGTCNSAGCVSPAYFYRCRNTESGHTSRAICNYGHIQ
jgi:hypothetical protein